MEHPLSVTELTNGLLQLGVRPGMMLEVHSSLRSLGYVEGGAASVIKALMNAVGPEGALVMPSFMISGGLPLSDEDKKMGIRQKIRILKEGEKNALGIIPATFRQMPGVLTGEGMKRVSAWGKDAGIHSSGYRHLIDNGGYALMIGVDIYAMSTMHYVEGHMPEKIRQMAAPSDEARKAYPADEWVIKSWVPSNQPWYTIQQRAYEKGYITDGMLGNSKCMLMQVKETIGLYRDALIHEPYKLFGLE
jgi:aminoglycoside N3'-acetyltransferase